MAKFTIPKGFQISHILPKFYSNKPLLNFQFEFTSNCIYDLGITHNEAVNKLYGISFGLIHNTTTIWGKLFKKHANSFRLGWNCSLQNRKIQLYAYYYNNGVRTSEYIADMDLNRQYSASIYFDRNDNKVMVDINSSDTLTSSFNSRSDYDFRFRNVPRWGMYLYFFFGGKLPAPHKMTVYVNKLN